MSAYLSRVMVGDRPELQKKDQIDGNSIRWLTSRANALLVEKPTSEMSIHRAHPDFKQ